jgi:hypothetical protein
MFNRCFKKLTCVFLSCVGLPKVDSPPSISISYTFCSSFSKKEPLKGVLSPIHLGLSDAAKPNET